MAHGIPGVLGEIKFKVIFITKKNFNQLINPSINRLFTHVASSELESSFKIRTL